MLFSAMVSAGQIDDALDFYDKNNFVEALKLAQPLATQGVAKAQA